MFQVLRWSCLNRIIASDVLPTYFVCEIASYQWFVPGDLINFFPFLLQKSLNVHNRRPKYITLSFTVLYIFIWLLWLAAAIICPAGAMLNKWIPSLHSDLSDFSIKHNKTIFFYIWKLTYCTLCLLNPMYSHALCLANKWINISCKL